MGRPRKNWYNGDQTEFFTFRLSKEMSVTLKLLANRYHTTKAAIIKELIVNASEHLPKDFDALGRKDVKDMLRGIDTQVHEVEQSVQDLKIKLSVLDSMVG